MLWVGNGFRCLVAAWSASGAVTTWRLSLEVVDSLHSPPALGSEQSGSVDGTGLRQVAAMSRIT
jgi:hypothetical protein